MPSFDDFLDLARKVAEYHGLEAPEQFYSDLSTRTRQAWPGERIYLVPLNSRKDSGRVKAITDAARRLPTGIVAARFGVTRQYVGQVLKKRNNPAA